MSRIADLFTLQEIDSALDQRRSTLAYVESQLGETEALISAREAVANGRSELKSLEKRQREIEVQVADREAKIAPLEKKLYDGSVRNPKELEGLNNDVMALKRHQRDLEDQVLAVMAEVEAAQDTLKAAQKELAAIEEGWREAQGGLLREQEELRREIERLEAQRSQQVALVNNGDLELYAVLRGTRQGRAVAKVEQGMCQGCRITLPMSALQKVRSGQGLVQCTSCERILYVI